MKKHNEETCEGCISTMGEEYCFDDIQEMMDYHKAERNWFVAKWEDWIYYPFYQKVVNGWWQKIRPGAIKHYYQRARYGYSYMDVWDTGNHIAEISLRMLECLKKDKIGTPMIFFEESDGIDEDEQPTEEAIRLAEERYDNILSEMIFGLKCAQALSSMEYDYKNETEYEKLNNSVKRSFELFGKYWSTLWD
ncbi:hypothetical protein H8D04_01325 [bacterium]|nr:hypothetical protein [bacterium]